MSADIYNQKLDWHGEGFTSFCFIDHAGEAYTLRVVSAGIDIFRDIEGNDCRIAQVDTIDDALAFIALYATQLIDC